MSVWRAGFLIVATVGVAAADPPPPAPAPSPPPAPTAVTPAAATPPWLLLIPPTSPPVLSLRIETARLANEQLDDTWRYPELTPLFGIEGNLWFVGAGRYRPRSPRSAALHGGSMAATLAGEILMSADSPLAGVGAFLTGAVLDDAAADADRNAEARR